MIKATFEKVVIEDVRNILPAGSLIPAWSTFTVDIQIPDRGVPFINLFDRCYFEVTKEEAFAALSLLSN
jgi:hypothetical protein